MNIVPIETAKTEAQSTLVMCEELRKLKKIDSIVPQPFLSVYVEKLIIDYNTIYMFIFQY